MIKLRGRMQDHNNQFEGQYRKYHHLYQMISKFGTLKLTKQGNAINVFSSEMDEI